MRPLGVIALSKLTWIRRILYVVPYNDLVSIGYGIDALRRHFDVAFEKRRSDKKK
jgi:hypothetical protein